MVAPVPTPDTLIAPDLNDVRFSLYQWGLAGIVVAYVLWRDHHRERRMAASIEAQQKWIRDTLLAALERNAKAMERMAWSFEQSIQADKPTRRMEAVDDHHG